MQLIRALSDLLFPRTCPGCGHAISEQGLPVCWDCRHALAIISMPLCDTCGEEVQGRVDHAYVCQVCVKRPPRYRQARAAIHYNALGKRLVTQFKYGGALWLQSLMTELLESCVRTHYDGRHYDAVCAVPLHTVKRRERGYNQAALLAEGLSKSFGWTVLPPRCLRRIRMTPSQTRLTARQRLSNVLGAFTADPEYDWKGKTVLLVDDVMTTGATVSTCAEALLGVGAEHVDVVTVARGL